MHAGTHVKMGQVIGNVGATGVATGPHLDFRISYKGKFINPLSLDSTGAVSKHKKSIAKNRSNHRYSNKASLKKKSSVKTARSGRTTKNTRG
jgi:murein DD-endopeptidase MepM/ murein hydrolase activator NlpD